MGQSTPMRYVNDPSLDERLKGLVWKLNLGWCADTSADPEMWRHDNPAFGQCAVTALVVLDQFGGHLLRKRIKAENYDGSHYYNRVRWGSQIFSVDLTYSQFVKPVPKGFALLRTRDDLLASEPTKRRYELLCSRLGFEPGGH